VEGLNLSVSNILAGLIFGTIGFSAFLYGKKQDRLKPMVVGVVLMAYPYFISNTAVLYAAGSRSPYSFYFQRLTQL